MLNSYTILLNIFIIVGAVLNKLLSRMPKTEDDGCQWKGGLAP
jgi:hypothetical protein